MRHALLVLATVLWRQGEAFYMPQRKAATATSAPTRLGMSTTEDEALYEILGVGRYAELKEIKTAYRRLAKKFHPDANPGKDTTDKFHKLKRAYETLADPDARRAYDAEIAWFERSPVRGPAGFGRFNGKHDSTSPFARVVDTRKTKKNGTGSTPNKKTNGASSSSTSERKSPYDFPMDGTPVRGGPKNRDDAKRNVYGQEAPFDGSFGEQIDLDSGVFQSYFADGMYVDIGAFGSGGSTTQGTSVGRVMVGEDLTHDLEIELETAIHGGEAQLTIKHLEGCYTCDSEGARKGSRVTTCLSCEGSGVSIEKNGYQQIRSNCKTCRGTGRRIQDHCRTCAGDGVTSQRKDLSVSIPPGVEDGYCLRVQGEGDAGPNGGPSGDLYIYIKVKQHDKFERLASEIYSNVTVSYLDAILGSTATVPVVGGEVTIDIPSGTQSGDSIVIRGAGAPRLDQFNVQANKHFTINPVRGDHHVRVLVKTPNELSDSEQALYKQLKAMQERKENPHWVPSENAFLFANDASQAKSKRAKEDENKRDEQYVALQAEIERLKNELDQLQTKEPAAIPSNHSPPPPSHGAGTSSVDPISSNMSSSHEDTSDPRIPQKSPLRNVSSPSKNLKLREMSHGTSPSMRMDTEQPEPQHVEIQAEDGTPGEPLREREPSLPRNGVSTLQANGATAPVANSAVPPPANGAKEESPGDHYWEALYGWRREQKVQRSNIARPPGGSPDAVRPVSRREPVAEPGPGPEPSPVVESVSVPSPVPNTPPNVSEAPSNEVPVERDEPGPADQYWEALYGWRREDKTRHQGVGSRSAVLPLSNKNKKPTAAKSMPTPSAGPVTLTSDAEDPTNSKSENTEEKKPYNAPSDLLPKPMSTPIPSPISSDAPAGPPVSSPTMSPVMWPKPLRPSTSSPVILGGNIGTRSKAPKPKKAEEYAWGALGRVERRQDEEEMMQEGWRPGASNKPLWGTMGAWNGQEGDDSRKPPGSNGKRWRGPY